VSNLAYDQNSNAIRAEDVHWFDESSGAAVKTTITGATGSVRVVDADGVEVLASTPMPEITGRNGYYQYILAHTLLTLGKRYTACVTIDGGAGKRYYGELDFVCVRATGALRS